MIYLKYFARYREWLQVSEEAVDAADGTNLEQLKKLIRDRHADAVKMLEDPRCIVAVNQRVVAINQLQICGDAILLRSGDEVAFYPPVTGG